MKQLISEYQIVIKKFNKQYKSIERELKRTKDNVTGKPIESMLKNGQRTWNLNLMMAT